jgi:signal transduction histidine kinase
MKILRRVLKLLSDYFARYPAVLSGYIIYSYYFVTTMSFYKHMKRASMDRFQIFSEFDGIIWMWLLAFVLVKVIRYRTSLQVEETIRIEREKQIEVQQTQLKTMREVIRTLQHEINNPLAIILGYVNQAEKEATQSPSLMKDLGEIRSGAHRIKKTLLDFSNANQYDTIDSSVGPMAQPKQA